MSTNDVVEAWKQQWREQGIEEGIEKGIEKGIIQTLVDIYEARFGAVPPELRAVLDGTHNEATLRSWSKLFGVRSADEIAHALLRAS